MTSRNYEYPRFNTPSEYFEFYNSERSGYYHDGIHPFETATLTWDEALAAIAQRYADELAAECGHPTPDGREISGFYDPIWEGEREGHLAAAGVEHIESWRTLNLGTSEEYCFYGTSNPSWRTGFLRFDSCEGCGYLSIGIAFAEVDENQRWLVHVWGD